jgi:hypothetical protein
VSLGGEMENGLSGAISGVQVHPFQPKEKADRGRLSEALLSLPKEGNGLYGIGDVAG